MRAGLSTNQLGSACVCVCVCFVAECVALHSNLVLKTHLHHLDNFSAADIYSSEINGVSSPTGARLSAEKQLKKAITDERGAAAKSG